MERLNRLLPSPVRLVVMVALLVALPLLVLGEIWVESEPGKGSRFTFALPADGM